MGKIDRKIVIDSMYASAKAQQSIIKLIEEGEYENAIKDLKLSRYMLFEHARIMELYEEKETLLDVIWDYFSK